ncbi:transcription termination/antitermination protein NusA [bacterium (Candidatus Gribaldobacteria) CG23_combo_of_CG06-09_8_20_14_all_37_87_8]|uniref:Transcription termination/antitermination protein NusA n=2 Tax=Candidatus Gribaldobacteria TaxID=2798536 RepID=A0A2G9ZFE8_9BACT|nr:MAG: transcription termination factor NusA [Parcubacteria group bacterium CG1_02_37_13]PIP31899.1 MAG: transcription termination/antitermination protein NusA [bacterium (Candidatus Gribaldobacteria) CG23_combo_of_CG06-09_8_20_14_all_37_87_8]PIR90210.1 MAG: transcription termination/antitermination protein NusA [bacterium (Candidatus Gribaldobacteria) CG10_big_fil_rev_8_21_14_0_10_37_21]
MDLKNLTSAVLEIAEERGIPQNKIIEVIEEAIASAYKKEYGKKKQKVKAQLDQKTGELKFWQVKEVVEPSMLYTEEELISLKEQPITEKTEREADQTEKIRFNPDRHILLNEALEINKEAKINEEVLIALEAKADFGRIAAQTAKQVILQKIKELEKEETFKEFKDKEGEIVSGIVQRIEPNVIFIDIGRTAGVLPKKEQIPNEVYKAGQRLKLFVLEAEQSSRGTQVVLSRAYPKIISKLFELEVPEIAANQVEIKGIAREAGSRSKVAVAGLEEGIDPIGALVGQRGTRILAVINEINGEKIDVIEWSHDPKKFIANALSPAKVMEIIVMPKNKAQAITQDEQLSLAIGKEGQNVRLAAKLTGWKIDVRGLSETEANKEESVEVVAQEETEAPEKPKKKSSKKINKGTPETTSEEKTK